MAPAVLAEAVVALELVLVALDLELALVALLLQFPARLLREGQLLRPVALPRKPEVAALLVLVQGLVASENLGSR